MPSQRPQINVRVSEDTVQRFVALVDRMRAATGIDNLSQADVIRLAILELEKKYPPTSAAPPAPAADQGEPEAKPGRGKARKK